MGNGLGHIESGRWCSEEQTGGRLHLLPRRSEPSPQAQRTGGCDPPSLSVFPTFLSSFFSYPSFFFLSFHPPIFISLLLFSRTPRETEVTLSRDTERTPLPTSEGPLSSHCPSLPTVTIGAYLPILGSSRKYDESKMNILGVRMMSLSLVTSIIAWPWMWKGTSSYEN